MPVPPNHLSNKNAHERDQHITFDEGPHIYTVHGEQGYTSVTTWNHSHFAEFDSDQIIDTMLKSKKMRDPNYKYYNMTKEEIKAQWDKNRDESASAGTKMHYDIECYYNGLEVDNTSVEFSFFKKFLTDFEEEYPNWVPYRTEWMVYFEELKISGSIDMVFENKETGELMIFDWKRCKEIIYDSYNNKGAVTECISHLPDTNFWHYSLQLNMYKTILERKYGKTVVALFLVCLHPENIYGSYDKIKVPFLDREMNLLIEYRKKQLEQKT